MLDKFERLRKKLNESIEQNGLNSEKTKKMSRKFDELINSYYEKEVQYSHESIMYKKYVESIDALSKITNEFVKFPSVAEWNKYAKEKVLLNSESIKYISGLNWHDLRNRIIYREIFKKNS